MTKRFTFTIDIDTSFYRAEGVQEDLQKALRRGNQFSSMFYSDEIDSIQVQKEEATMTQVYVLTEVDSSGTEMFKGVFPDEASANEEMKKSVKVSVVLDVPVIKFTKNFRLHKHAFGSAVAVPTASSTVVPADTRSILVASDSIFDKEYTVRVRGNQVVSCSCPDFEHRSKDNTYYSCKHMKRVIQNPTRYNADFNIYR